MNEGTTRIWMSPMSSPRSESVRLEVFFYVKALFILKFFILLFFFIFVFFFLFFFCKKEK
jgi:hypothetical protein